jgi:hypothetical protein
MDAFTAVFTSSVSADVPAPVNEEANRQRQYTISQCVVSQSSDALAPVNEEANRQRQYTISQCVLA